MKLAVRMDGGELHGLGGYHYMLHPMEVTDDEADVWELMGYVILTIEAEMGERLLKQARAALHHQVQVAVLTDKAIKAKKPE